VAVNLYGTDDDERECDMPDKTIVTAGIKMASFPDGNKQSLNYISIFEEMVGLILQSNVDNALEMYKPDITIHIPKSSAKSFDFHKAEELIEIGRVEAGKSIALYKENGMFLQMEREAGSGVNAL
jgi:hypothetical protein